MINENHIAFISAVITAIAAFATMGGLAARYKRRPPMEGVLLGMFLGPIGVALELRASYNHRPLVDQRSQTSLNSLLVYQANLVKADRPKGEEV